MSATDQMSEPSDPSGLRVLVFGTADLTKPRVRLLLKGLRLEGHEIIDCTRNIWAGVADKSQVRSKLSMLGLALNWFWSMLVLSLRYLVAPKHDVVLVCYPGHLDLWFIRPLAWLRRKPVIWDAFLSAYDTIVLDRRMAEPGSLLGRLTYSLDWCACRLSDRLFLDTPSHAAFFSKAFRVPANKVGSVPVGAEAPFARAKALPAPDHDRAFRVLFYGQLIPLHGIDVILDAAEMLKDAPVRITLVGQGQLSPLVNAWTEKHDTSILTAIDWVDYGDLPALIAAHDLCLGIFSGGDKAARVVPNKVYQIAAVGVPLLTRQSPAMDAYAGDAAGMTFVPPDNAAALAEAILKNRQAWISGTLLRPPASLALHADTVGAALHAELTAILKK